MGRVKKRRFLTVFVLIACGLSVVGGHFYYNNKLEETAYAAKLELNMTQKEETTKEIATEEVQKPSETPFANAPQGVADLFKQKKDVGEALKFHLIGSTNTSTEEGTWAQLFTAKMADIYGKDVDIKTTSIGEMTSLELQENTIYEEIQSKKSDIIVIEPPLLNDNDGISMEDTLFVLGNMIDGINETNPDAMVFIQPSNPISSPNKYADQVNELEAYTKDQNIPFLNFWSSWPSVDSEEIRDYYNSDTLLPNKEGHKLWADYMLKQFN